ncbi:hypothetical protein HDV06_002985 [Boothiomyces sp. JEL0866]|nr:hypothetical protein HDV06_002985 [Boothiomyces sp. JEL0866]
MFKLIAIAAFALANPCPYAHLAKRGETATSQSAHAQLQQVWSEINNSNANPTSFTYNVFGLVTSEDMHPTVDTASDELPIVKGIFSSSKRQKEVHAAGAVVQATFDALPGSPYTGLFQGAQDAVVRFSLANAPSTTTIVPGAAMKFFIQNQPSANIFFMLGIDGQNNDPNFFSNNFSNHISPKEGGAIAGGLLLHTFGKASNWPVFTGLNRVARFDAQGNPVSSPVYPFQVVMRPTAAAQQAIASSLPNTDSSDIYRSLKALTGLPAGTQLWTVWASPEPNAAFTQIGSISTKSNVVLNDYGNTDLFFQHQTFEQDTAAGSIGESWAKTCPNAQSCVTCHSLANNNCVFQ